jgi:hypothetical protein
MEEIVNEVLSAAESDDRKGRSYEGAAKQCNLDVLAGEVKLRSHLVAFAHELCSKEKGFVEFNTSIQECGDVLNCQYEGTIVRPTPIDFAVSVTLSNKTNGVKVKFGDDEKKTSADAIDFRKVVEFLFDYAVTEIKEWPSKVEEVVQLEIAKEEEECELE